MDHPISMDGNVWLAANERLEALNKRYVLTSDNRQQSRDNGNMKEIMNCELYHATKEGHVEKFIDALEKLSESRELALSLIFDQVTPSGNSLLHVAASFGSDEVMELILLHFPGLMTRKNYSEDTPLHVAIQHGRLKTTEMLMCWETNSKIIYWKNKDNKSPLYLAADTGNMKILQLLLDAYVKDEAYAVNIEGKSPILATLKPMARGFSGYSNVVSHILKEIIHRLPKLLQLRDEDGGTPLHSSASGLQYWAMDILLHKCPDLTLSKDKNGSYPVHIACEGGKFYIIKRLLSETWPDVAELKNNKGQNILHVAAKGGNNIAVSMISERFDKDIIEELANSKDVDGNTPLHLAAMHNHCKVLLNFTRKIRSDLRLLNNDNLTALDVAMKSRSLSMKYPALLGCAILIRAGVRQSKGPNFQLRDEQAEQMTKEQVSTRLLVATLVVTVTFAAGFTLPGGYNASSDLHPGTATMLHNRVFQVFVISNVLAMYSSILAVVILLWGHVTDFHVAKRAYFIAGPLLLTAHTGMAVAFMAAVIVAVRELTWLALLVQYIAIFFLMMLILVLAAWILPPSWAGMIFVVPPYLCWTLVEGPLGRTLDYVLDFCCCCLDPCLLLAHVLKRKVRALR